MKTSLALSVGLCMLLPGSALAVQNEIFGLFAGGYRIQRYDAGASTFLDCGPVMGGKFVTNLAMDNNRRLYYMHPFDFAHDIWQADLDGGNQLINQVVLDTLTPGLGIIDGFTIGPDQNLYMTGYGHSEIYRYIIGSNNQTAATEVTLVAGSQGLIGEFRSDLAFDPLTGYLVGIGIVPDGSGRRSLFQIPGALAMNGINDNYSWEYFGGNSSPWASTDLGSPTNPSGPLGPNPDGVAFDPTTNALYLSGDGEKFSLWNRSAATLTNYIPIGGPDTGMGFDLAFQQTVPEPSTLVLLGISALGLLCYAGRMRRQINLGRTLVTQQASSISAYRRTAFAVMALSIVSVGSGRAPAAVLYATSIAGNQIDKVDTVANTVTLYLSTPSAADSVMFDTAQRAIYTQLNTGQVRRFDPNTSTDSLIASGFFGPADIVLEPGGNTMLVSEFYGAKIDRINLTTNAVTTLLNAPPSGGPEGLAYYGTRLFANLGNRNGGPTGKYVAEINPTTGAILATSPGLDSLDGLTYDPYSGLLYASSLYGNCVLSIDPNNLNNVNNVTSKLGQIPGPDGITTDGAGNIFIAGGGDSYIYQLDLVNNVLAQKTFVYGLDDLAPASGLGSMPEPSTLVLLGIGAAGYLAWAWRRRRN